MPPKKRKAATASKSDGTHTMWLLIYASKGCRGGPQEEREEVLYSTKEKAISGLPNLMDKFANIGNDWRDGLKGFGREEADPYLGFEYFGEDIMKKSNQRLLIWYKACHNSEHKKYASGSTRLRGWEVIVH